MRNCHIHICICLGGRAGKVNWGLGRLLWAPVASPVPGPLGPGSCVRIWALVGQALVVPPGPLWARRLWVPIILAQYRVWRSVGVAWAPTWVLTKKLPSVVLTVVSMLMPGIGAPGGQQTIRILLLLLCFEETHTRLFSFAFLRRFCFIRTSKVKTCFSLLTVRFFTTDGGPISLLTVACFHYWRAARTGVFLASCKYIYMDICICICIYIYICIHICICI